MDPEDLFGVDIGAIRARIKTLAYFTDVQDIQGASEATGGMVAFIPPAAFVSIARESYAPNRYASGGHAQLANVVISVLFCVPAVRADRDAGDEVEQARKAILAVLKGWSPPGADKALEAVDYRVRVIEGGLVWSEWQFRTSFDNRVVAAP